MCGISIILIGTFIALQIRYPKKYSAIIESASKSYGVEYEVIQAVIWTESKYKPSAVSGAGAKGLMQIMPATAVWLAEKMQIEYSEEKLFDPSYNINMGVYYLSYLQKRFDFPDSIAAYNAGEGNVRKWNKEGLTQYPFKETKEYVERVVSVKKIYKYFSRIK